MPQFTLAADTAQGHPGRVQHRRGARGGRQLFDYLLTQARAAHATVAAGEFGADMQVSLVNDGPVTFWLEAPAADRRGPTSQAPE